MSSLQSEIHNQFVIKASYSAILQSLEEQFYESKYCLLIINLFVILLCYYLFSLKVKEALKI